MSDTIISMITIGVTLLLGLVGFITNSLIQRKSNSIAVITETRIDRRKRTQELAAKLLMYGDSLYLDCVKESERATLVQDSVKTLEELRVLYTYTVKEDYDLIQYGRELVRQITAYFTADRDEEVLQQAHDEFNHAFDCYITTEWGRIKVETVGKKKKSDLVYGSWQDNYKANLEKITKQGKKPAK